MHQQIEKLFKKGKGYARLREVKAAGINPYQLRKLEEEGKVVKVSRGLYRWQEDTLAEEEMTEVGQIVPKGVFCLYSALAFYELTDYVPHQYHLAIERSKKITLPAYPPIKLYYWSPKAYQTGITQLPLDQKSHSLTHIAIYEMEKTIADVIKYRNKLGVDLVSQTLKSYLKRKDRNIEKLIAFAKVLRVEKILQNYLSLLL
jgi:predicted transcriptional regulator of viral defense system